MHFIERTSSSRDTAGEARLKTPVHPGSSVLRRAVRGGIVSFPAQIPVLLKQPRPTCSGAWFCCTLVRGWSSARIGARFNVPKHRIRKTLTNGLSGRLALGYVQVIDQEAFAACCRDDAEDAMSRGAEEIQLAAVGPAPDSVSLPVLDAEPAVDSGCRSRWRNAVRRSVGGRPG